MGKLLYFKLDYTDEERLEELADEILLRDQLGDVNSKHYDFCMDLIDLRQENYLKNIYDKYKNKLKGIEDYYEARESLKEEFKNCKMTRKRNKLKAMMDELERDIINIVENSIYPLPNHEKISLDTNILEVKKNIDELIIDCDLTDEEIDIYFMIIDGNTYKDVAKAMNTNHIKIHTKVNDIKNKLEKLNIDYI